MELPDKYDPSLAEEKWYRYWIEHKFFHSEPDEREPYTIVIPPPNVTGVLHMGHMMNNTLQDVLVRRARMKGKNALWVPGTDHASIATEAKVVGRLAEKGIRKQDLTREEFLRHAWDWTNEHGGIILKQLRRLGASCDWDRTAFTMDGPRSESVLKVFCDLYDKGLIYRGLRMVNWDPKARTALSNIEVIYREEKSKLYYLKYYLADTDTNPVVPTGVEGEVLHKDEKGWYAVVATTRPETIMGDTAMCINPKDPKNGWLKGHKVTVPLVGRAVPVIEDRYVDVEFGTGCLKVTPAHDVNDYNLGKTHNLETIDIFNPDGTLSPAAGLYVGMDRMACRKQIAADLQEAGLMEKVEDYVNKVGYSERNPNTAVEPRLCKQWYLKMEHLAQIALKPVLDGNIKFHPDKFVNTYRNWLENIDDWCISRQLWWGHRIPAYYLPGDGSENETFVVALNEEEALQKARKIKGYENISAADLRHDEDALDTWFSSWLWPVSLFDGINDPGNKEIRYYYPTSDLVTGPDIIFFWVARMIMAGEEYMGDVPFRNVYFTGIVRDKLGRKMSKQLGNSPDPIGLIEKYGADGVRLGILLCTSAGNDILFDESQVEQGRNFSNKIWNAFRLVQGWKEADVPQSKANRVAVEWFRAKLEKTLAQIDADYGKFRINDAVMATYKLFWDDFCAWYLETVKPAYHDGVQDPVDSETYQATKGFFDVLLKMLHPVMPFITEELWQNLQPRKEGETIMLQRIPETVGFDEKVIERFETAQQAIASVRAIRQQKNISPKTPLKLQVAAGAYPEEVNPVIEKLGGISDIDVCTEIDTSVPGQGFLVGTIRFFVPLQGMIDAKEQKEKILAEIARYEGFLKGVNAKLGNARFVENAPAAVVELERKKQSDATEKLNNLRAELEKL
ncbi:MAG: valine--tRNA ligase [Bacteroidales bacterium]|nr:valine--tRNA ligase [Candidatus Cacconaster scatequi]